LQALYKELIVNKKNLSQIKLPHGEHLKKENIAKENFNEKNKNVNLTRSKKVNQVENKSSSKVSDQVNDDKSSSEKGGGIEQIDAYFDKKLYDKVVDVYRKYFKGGNKLPLDKKHVNYLSYSLYKTVS
jgi:hypothetical protein